MNNAINEFDIFDNNSRVIQPVFRKSSSLSNILFSQKKLTTTKDSTGLSKGGTPTVGCADPTVVRRGRRCDSCQMMGGVPFVNIRGAQLHLSGGNCQTSLLIYLGICVECSKPYMGKTVNELRTRINGHRSHLKEMKTADTCSDEFVIDDTNCLAAHAYFCHGIKESKGFNLLYKFSIVQKLCDPKLLLRREQFYINTYKTFVPHGLNVSNPIGLHALLTVQHNS